MNLNILWGLIGVCALPLGWVAWEFFKIAPGENPLLDYTVIVGTLGMGIGIFWILLSLLIAYVVVPKADALIDPNQPFDDFLFRHFRALNYGGACTFRWANRRTLDFDCRTLPTEIRYPLIVHFISLHLFFFLRKR